MDVKNLFFRDLKLEGLLTFNYTPGDEIEADIFTKNVEALVLHKHAEKFCGKDGLYDKT